MTRKLRNTGRILDVSRHLDDVLQYLRGLDGLVAVYLYGSYGTRYQTPLSDIDLALVFDEQNVPGGKLQLEIVGRVMQTLHEDDVSVTFLNDAPLSFRHKVLAEGRLLLLLDEIAHADFLERTISRYCDFAVAEQHFFQEYDEALVEDYRDGTR
jgi:predicted nucleotidyltransferase